MQWETKNHYHTAQLADSPGQAAAKDSIIETWVKVGLNKPLSRTRVATEVMWCPLNQGLLVGILCPPGDGVR